MFGDFTDNLVVRDVAVLIDQLTHVFPIVKLDGEWIIADATYSLNVLGYNLGGYDRIEVLGPQNVNRSRTG